MKILLTGLSTRALAETALQSEHTCVSLDAFGDLDTHALCESYSLLQDFQLPYHPVNLFAASQQLAFDAVAYTANFENYPGVLQQFQRRQAVIGNPPEVLAAVRNWPVLYQELAQAGYLVPRTVYAGKPPPAPENPALRWLRKPVRGGGGHGITFSRRSRPAGQGFLLQEYLDGVPGSASFVANGRQAVVLGMTEQLIGRREFFGTGFRYCGNILPLQAAAEATLEQVQGIAGFLTRRFGLVGLNGFDFILHAGQVCLTEVNPRFSASMELIASAYGLPVFEMHCRAVLQAALPDFDLRAAGLRTPAQFYGKAILYAPKDGCAPQTEDWHRRGVRDVPWPGSKITRHAPICTVLGQGPTRESCFSSLVTQANALIGEIYA